MHEVAVPALDEGPEDLCIRGLTATLKISTLEAFGPGTAGLCFEFDHQHTFTYQLCPVQRDPTDHYGVCLEFLHQHRDARPRSAAAETSRPTWTGRPTTRPPTSPSTDY